MADSPLEQEDRRIEYQGPPYDVRGINVHQASEYDCQGNLPLFGRVNNAGVRLFGTAPELNYEIRIIHKTTSSNVSALRSLYISAWDHYPS